MPNTSLFINKIQLTRPQILTEGPTPEEEALISAHFNYLKGLTEKGVTVFIGRTLTTDPDSYGLIVFQAASEDAAWEIVRLDPGVAAGLWQAELRPFRIALMSTDLMDWMP